MSFVTNQEPEPFLCNMCRGEVEPSADRSRGMCTRCGAYVAGPGRYSVQGADAKEVTEVIAELERQHLANRGPWRAGLFYLLCLVVITTLFLAVAHFVPVWVLPVVVAAALIGVSVLGALQLRQDGRISEKGMLTLVRAAFRNARSLGGSQPPGAGPPAV